MHFIQDRKKWGQELFLREVLLEAKGEEALFYSYREIESYVWKQWSLCRIVEL